MRLFAALTKKSEIQRDAAEVEAVVEPGRVPDDDGWETVPLVGVDGSVHAGPGCPSPPNLTVLSGDRV